MPSSGFYDVGKITVADAPTVQMATPSPLSHQFYAGCPSCRNPSNLSWPHTGMKYAGLHSVTWLLQLTTPAQITISQSQYYSQTIGSFKSHSPEQESCAIAKMTVRCTLYIGVLVGGCEPNLGEEEVIGGCGWYHSKEHWWLPIGPP